MDEQPKHVLLVDDDETILHLYSDTLKGVGFTVTRERSPIDALDRIMKQQKFDLLITDIRMVEMDGWTLIDTIRKDLDISELVLPIIVMSAYDSSEMELNCLKHKANSWMVKPIIPLTRLIEATITFTGGRTTPW
jgi:CheY-like chemotaxis protein